MEAPCAQHCLDLTATSNVVESRRVVRAIFCHRGTLYELAGSECSGKVNGSCAAAEGRATLAKLSEAFRDSIPQSRYQAKPYSSVVHH